MKDAVSPVTLDQHTVLRPEQGELATVVVLCGYPGQEERCDDPDPSSRRNQMAKVIGRSVPGGDTGSQPGVGVGDSDS
jgi:hypothetical protein